MKATRIFKKQRIRNRIRKKISGSAVRPRLSVFRSNKGIYCQIIDDVQGVTLVSASSMDSSIASGVNKTEQARLVGKIIAEKAVSSNINNIVFDRSGYIYHGRIKALADGAREGGLNF
ncbi:MAG: 50S ribosomal protein L18 [Saprospiraceae bacterium]|nr:50S ribosomal protein L18 [Saprospiraceae bacterium]